MINQAKVLHFGGAHGFQTNEGMVLKTIILGENSTLANALNHPLNIFENRIKKAPKLINIGERSVF
jgi:hypothetical protein